MNSLKLIITALLLSTLSLAVNSQGHEDGHHHEQISKEARESPADSLIELYISKIKEDPDDYYNYTKLGASYIQKGREVGGIGPYLQAEEVLKKSIELYPDGYAAYVYLGQVSSYKHNFHKTIQYARKAIELKPEKSIPYGVLGDAYIELGMYDEAERAYLTASMIAPGFFSDTRIAQIKDLKGDTKGAIELMNNSIQLASGQNLPAENIAWAKVMLGSFYFKTGDLEKAEKSYEEALQSFNNHYLAMEHLAEVYTARGDYEKAAALYEKALELNPKPHYYLKLGEVYEKLGRPAKSEELYGNAEARYKEYAESGIKGHSRELVLFYADKNVNLDRALELAKGDSDDTEDIYAYDTLAWAYYKTGNLDKAMDSINKSLRLGTKDALLYYHAGVIYHKLGKKEEAAKYFDLVLATNPFFDKEAVNEVRYALSKLGKSSS
jgi:tetratricopeptide (TPR) repeat protein